MMSLAEELRKFQKITYENDLDGIITVEDNFSNGSVTIRDLVKENHVIISEFKRMKNVFINYTKINQKIYDKITEHELTFGSSILKLGHMTNFFEKTIEGTLNQMKVIYEDTVHVNSLAGMAVDQRLKPVYQQIGKKLDIKVFNQAVKMLHQGGEHDFGEAMHQSIAGSVEEGSERGERLQLQRKDSVDLRPKSRNLVKKISEQELNNIRFEIEDQLKKLSKTFEETISQIYTKIQQNMSSNVTLNQESIRQVYAKIAQLSFESSNEDGKIKESIHTLTNTLQSKTSQVVWDHHRSTILQEMRHKMGPIFDQLDNVSKGYNQMGAELSKSIILSKQEMLQQMRKLNKQLTQQIEQNSRKITKNNSHTNQRIDDSNRNHKDFKDSIEKAMTDMTKVISSHRQQTVSQIIDLRDTIDKLTLTLQASVLKLVVKRFTETISSLVAEVRDLKKLEADTSKRVSISFENINDIKQVIGRKANYADIVNLFEKKANKEEMFALKDIISAEMFPRRQDSPNIVKRPRRAVQSGRLKTTIGRSKKQQQDRSLSSSFTVGCSHDKIKNKVKLVSKHFQLRPFTAELPIFN